LHVAHDGTEFEDAASANGTRINAERLVKGARRVMHAGDIVEMGAAVLFIRDNVAVPTDSLASGTSKPVDPMTAVDRFVSLLAPGSLPIILLGETGVGKDVWARRIHDRSFRKDSPFVAINCAAIPEQLLESELFGHEKGAFTGADRARIGLLETAGKGTVLLDEVAEIPAPLQAKLLRALEGREILPVGSSQPRPIHARFLSASNRHLEALVASGDFRADLFFRLNGLSLRIPPLRERLAEIEPLARGFATATCESLGKRPPGFAPRAIGWLRTQSWPGNIRELKNRVECACLLCGEAVIDVEHLAADTRAAGAVTHPTTPGLWNEFQTLQRQRILEALSTSHGNQTRAATLLGISRRMLINRLDEYGVERPRRK
jgi:transcriptional regulator with PAS, ATPase and Fis domain